MSYDHLIICIRPKNPEERRDLLIHPVPSSFNRWIKEWLKELLIEDYEELQFVKSSIAFGLFIPMKNVNPLIAYKLERSASFQYRRVLISSCNIKQDEFEVTDCYMGSDL